MKGYLDANGDPINIGDRVMLVRTKGEVSKAHAGRVVTVRRDGRGGLLCVDDGDPANPDLVTNGFRLAMWIPPHACRHCLGPPQYGAPDPRASASGDDENK